MLQYALIFESVLFTFTIIYITFLFSLDLLPLSPYLLFLPSVSLSPSPKCISSLSLSLHFFALSLSLSTPRHCLPFRQNSSRSIKPRHATPHKPDLHSQIAVHQHSHTNPTHHIHNNPWPDRHATPCRRACRAIHHVIGTSHHRISLNRPTVVGFAFGFV